jgi:hydroxymethylglutaryl-CoA reductase
MSGVSLRCISMASALARGARPIVRQLATTPVGKVPEVPKFRDMTPQQRLDFLSIKFNRPPEFFDVIRVGDEHLASMNQNVIGGAVFPLSLVLDVQITTVSQTPARPKLCALPLVCSETSTVAAAQKGTDMANKTGGFFVKPAEALMRAQVQLVGRQGISDDRVSQIKDDVLRHKEMLLDAINVQFPNMKARGGGAQDIQIVVLPPRNPSERWMWSVNVVADVCDSQGANWLNKVVTFVAPLIQRIIGDEAETLLRILSNNGDLRVAEAWATFPASMLAVPGISGAEMVERILLAANYAERDYMRGVTSDKGSVGNGGGSVVLAVDEDTRGYYAALSVFPERPFTRYRQDDAGDLVGHIRMPTVAGLTGKRLPFAALMMQMCEIDSAKVLSGYIAVASLALNVCALRSLTDPRNITYHHETRFVSQQTVSRIVISKPS